MTSRMRCWLGLRRLDTGARNSIADGMSAFGFKGGIGTSSRRLDLDGRAHHRGVLVLANFRRAGDFHLPDGRIAAPATAASEAAIEKGSVIVIMATDVPLSDRQLKRVVRRYGVGLALLGPFLRHGSGDIALGITTATAVVHDEAAARIDHRVPNENRIDSLFAAMANATQKAVLDILVAAGSMTGRDGHHRPGLAETLNHLRSQEVFGS